MVHFSDLGSVSLTWAVTQTWLRSAFLGAFLPGRATRVPVPLPPSGLWPCCSPAQNILPARALPSTSPTPLSHRSLCARHCAPSLPDFLISSPEVGAVFIPDLERREQNTKGLSVLPRVTQLGSGRATIPIQAGSGARGASLGPVPSLQQPCVLVRLGAQGLCGRRGSWHGGGPLVVFGEWMKPWHSGPGSQFHVRMLAGPPLSHDGTFGLLLLTKG